MKTTRRVNGGRRDLVELVMDMGLGRTNATMVIPYMWFTPGGSDAYSPVVLMIVKTMQEKLRQLGFPNRGDGWVDPATASALIRISGHDWKSKAWVQIYGDILSAAQTGVAPTATAMEGLGMYLSEPTAGSRWGSLGAVSGAAPLPVTDWCSDKNPQQNCNPLKNICKPMYVPVLGAFKMLQTQINRAMGRPVLWVDGRIGPQTIRYGKAAFKKMGAPLGSAAGQGHCDWWAEFAATLGTSLGQINDDAGLPMIASKPAKGPAPAPAPGGLVTDPPMPAQAGIGALLSSPTGVAILAGGIALFVFMQPKAKKRKPVKRRRRRRLPKSRVTRTTYR